MSSTLGTTPRPVIGAGTTLCLRASTTLHFGASAIADGCGPVARIGEVRALRLRRVPSAALASASLVEVAAVVLSWGLEAVWDTLIYGFTTIVLAVVGALVASRQPRNPIGWLVLGAAVVSASSPISPKAWALRGWPGAGLAETFFNPSTIPQAAATVVCLAPVSVRHVDIPGMASRRRSRRPRGRGRRTGVRPRSRGRELLR